MNTSSELDFVVRMDSSSSAVMTLNMSGNSNTISLGSFVKELTTTADSFVRYLYDTYRLSSLRGAFSSTSRRVHSIQRLSKDTYIFCVDTHGSSYQKRTMLSTFGMKPRAVLAEAQSTSRDYGSSDTNEMVVAGVPENLTMALSKAGSTECQFVGNAGYGTSYLMVSLS